ncbi:LPS-assembly lipoprotein LptE [Methylomonas sp. MgM2]
MRNFSKLVLVFVLSLSTACGYHLRGSMALSSELESVYVFGMSGNLNREVKALMKASRINYAASPNQAGVVIKVLKEDMRRRVISLGQTGKSQEMELEYYLRFQFYDNKENPLLREQTIELSRDFFNDQLTLLAKENEETTIRSEMYRQVARMLISRAEAAAKSKKDNDAL